MRAFEYFLFENFDADRAAKNPLNPRNFLGSATDAVLSAVINGADMQTVDGALLDKLVQGGILRREAQQARFACPVFLREDAKALRDCVAIQAASLADRLETCADDLLACCKQMDNRFPASVHLYHVLCGMVFDGRLFDYLEKKGALTTGKRHQSGLDYLCVVYEKCPKLQAFADGLLCSYNRLMNARCALQSFGDAQGDRHDFYRLFRLMEQGSVPPRFERAAALMMNAFGGMDKEALLSETQKLIASGSCDERALKLLEHMGYARDGEICVSVYGEKDRKNIDRIARIVESCLGDAIVQTLRALSSELDITAVRHGVAAGEIANELYHIVFGGINEELVKRGIVATPPFYPGEGRYLKSIALKKQA